MDDDQQFCLRWNNHQSTLISVFDTLLEKGIHVDCTLAAEGQTLKAHKVVLSACSPYFESVLSQQYDKHPIIILKDVKFAELRAMMDYMYRGEVNISQDQLGALLKAAESLQIKGLSDSKPPPAPSNPPHPRPVTPPPKVRSVRASPGGDIDEGSREGSISPSRRKRKKRRTSLSPLPPHPLTHAVTLPVPAPLPPAPLNHAAVTLPLTLPRSNHSPQPVLNNSAQVTLAPPPPAGVPVPLPIPAADTISEENDTMAKIKRIQFGNEPVAKAKLDIDVDIPAVVRPKAEYSDDGMEESVEDLTLDEEADSDGDGDGELEHSGYPWPLDRSQDESITGQDGHRDSQAEDMSFTRIGGLSWEQWSARLAVPVMRGAGGVGGPGAGDGFACPDCGRVYKLKSSLRNHQKWECGKEPQFQCPHCVYRAKQKMHIARHMERMHREKVYLKGDAPLCPDNLDACT